MELRHLRYLVVVAEEQNVTRAAERLHVSQPPLSRQIRDLEAELGVALFRRTAKSLALTEAGKIFLIEARGVLLQVDKAVLTVRTVAANLRGHLRIGYAPSLTVKILPKGLRSFEGMSPGVRVALHDLSTEECVQKLNARKLDVALIVRPSASSMRGLVFEQLTTYPICAAVAVTHPLARRRSVTLAQLAQEKLLGYAQEDYPEYFDWLLRLFPAGRFDACNVEQYDSATGLIAAVEAGRGVALVSTSMKCITGPRVKLLPLAPALPPIVVGALYPRESLSDLARKFINAIKAAA